MEIERLNIVLVPRRAWTALDLGFALGRVWFFRLCAAWAIVAVPALALILALPSRSLWLSMLVLWWLKPAYEQLPLYVLSRAVFDDPPPFRAVLRQTWPWLGRGLLANLSWRRLAASRSFTAPVVQLEGLRGRERRARLKILHETGNVGAWLTIASTHFESLLYGCGLIVGYALLPEEFSLREVFLGQKQVVEFAQLLILFAAMAAIAPFFVAAGFSLYLQRRAQIEGWDIELVFRRLRARASKPHNRAANILPALMVVMFAFGTFGMCAPLLAEETAPAIEPANRVIAEVLQDPDFGTKRTVTDWRWKRQGTEQATSPPNWLFWIARFSEYLMWIAIVGLIVYALYRLPEWLARLPRQRRDSPKVETAATTLFGLDLRQESLPKDIPAAARALIDRGEIRQALALLYRGALALLMTHDGIAFRDGHTEGECLAQVRARCSPPIAGFFGQLTADWQRTAYGHVLPAKTALVTYCRAWAEHFGYRA